MARAKYLPLELRQLIYTHMLPEDRTINFPFGPREKALFDEKALLATCHLFDNQELRDTIFRECGAHITISPHEDLTLPEGMPWYRFQWIKITIDHYDESKPLHKTNVYEMACSLRTGEPPEILPPMTIQFRESIQKRLRDDDDDADADSCPPRTYDPTWTAEVLAESVARLDRGCRCFVDQGVWVTRTCHEFPGELLPGYYNWSCINDDDAEGYVQDLNQVFDVQLRTLDIKFSEFVDLPGTPLVTLILDDLLALPPCKSATVHCLCGLQQRRPKLWRYDPERRIFDQTYADDLCAALELWLTGHRDLIQNSTGRQYPNVKDLERLAYLRREGEHYYCDVG